VSAGRIREAALARFAAQGYDATPLAQIAADAGIKAPSIYAHFSGKEALFRELVEYASAKELDILRQSLQRRVSAVEAMRDYLYGTIDRYAHTPHLKFWLRTLYLPPVKVRPELPGFDRRFAQGLEEIVGAALRHPEFGLHSVALAHETVSTAFVGMLRSVHAELLNRSSSDSKKTLSAMWSIFQRALRED
jgi:AcrR family transcriptional regulator